MSSQGYYNNQGPPPPSGNQQTQGLQSNNPFAQSQTQYQQPQQPQQYPPQPSYGQQTGGYGAPPGPPPATGNAFKESDFVPDSERGEQREAIEQFEMNRSKPESVEDRDVAALQQEFPSVDGSLIAAIYGDSKSLAATREMLQELASQK